MDKMFIKRTLTFDNEQPCDLPNRPSTNRFSTSKSPQNRPKIASQMLLFSLCQSGGILMDFTSVAVKWIEPPRMTDISVAVIFHKPPRISCQDIRGGWWNITATDDWHIRGGYILLAATDVLTRYPWRLVKYSRHGYVSHPWRLDPLNRHGCKVH